MEVERMRGVAHLPGNTRCPKLGCNRMIVDHPMDENAPGVYVICDGARVKVIKYGGAKSHVNVTGDPRIQRPR